MDRKTRFDKQFQETLTNFAMNIDFMNNQQKKVNELVTKAQKETDSTVKNMD